MFGQKAKEMINRNQRLIEVVAPVKKGVVADLGSSRSTSK